MANITQLPKTQFSGLEFANIMEDIYNLVNENPDYNSNWDDFLNSNAGRMLTEIFAWIADQLATRIDWVVNENFIGTATQKSSIIKLLKLINYKFSLPVAARVPVDITFSRGIGTYEFTPTYLEGTGNIKYKTIQGIDKKGQLRRFEAIDYDSANQKYSYKVPVSVYTGTSVDPKLNHQIVFHEGTTKVKTFLSNSNSGQKFIIPDKPIIRNSIVLYKVTTQGSSIIEEELLEVDNFLDSKAQLSYDGQGTNAIPYVLNVREDDSVEIEFGPVSLLPTQDRRLPQGVELRAFYRVGGGVDGNIARQAINLTEKPTFGGAEVIINFKNSLEGIGGEDSESIEHAAYHGPLKIRTAGKTVTPEDYDIILASHTSILLSKSYGYNNIPADYFDKYGTYFNPLEVVNFVILKKPGWETIPTSKYYLADWGTFNLENRFNGNYWFNNGSFGNPIQIAGNDITFNEVYDYDNQGGKEFKNFIVLKTPEDFKESIFLEDPVDPNNFIANPDLIASLTEDKYTVETHTLISQLNGHLVNADDPYFYGDYNNTGFPRIELRSDIQAYFRSTMNLSSGLNISTGQNRFIINIDGQGDITVDMSKGGVSPAIIPLDTVVSPYVEGIVDIINNAISSAYVDVKAYQDFGILIEDTTAQVPNLENRDEENWIMRITGINYTINTGVDQSYDQMMIQINSVINAANYEAIFIQNRVNITCWDIRIQRMDNTGNVVLEDSNSPYDILVAYEASPLSTMPISSGDYSNVATKVVDELGEHVKLTSPNSGSTSTINLRPPVNPYQDCMPGLFGLSFLFDNVAEYNCYGQTALTIIYRDTTEIDFGYFIYEHGTINLSPENPEVIYLNYIKKIKDRIKLGYYFNENFSVEEPEWKPIDNRLYNSNYIVDPTDPDARRELFDLDGTNTLLRFTKEETLKNSIYIVNNDYQLVEATAPSITTKVLSPFPDLTGKVLTIQISNNIAKVINLDTINSLSDLVFQINLQLDDDANEAYGKSIPFAIADIDNNTITLSIDNKRGGTISIIGEPSSGNTLLFDGISDPTENRIVYPNGDYYLEYNTETDSTDMIKIPTAQNIPDTPFYIHYVADRRHVFIDPEVDKIHTDEDDLKAFMFPYKIAGVENTFKRPVFSTFDVSGEIFISKAIPKAQIQYNVDKAIRDAYSIYSAEFNKPVIKSELSKIIMDVPGVRYVEIKYFGKDLLDSDSNLDSRIVAGFDEIIILSDSIFDATGLQEHGQEWVFNTL